MRSTLAELGQCRMLAVQTEVLGVWIVCAHSIRVDTTLVPFAQLHPHGHAAHDDATLSDVRTNSPLVLMVLLVLALSPASALADGPRRETILAGDRPFPRDRVILLDASGSMSAPLTGTTGTAYARAVAEARFAAEAAEDDGRLLFAAFNDSIEDDPQGWWKTPDAERLDASLAWLAARPVRGTTELVAAVLRYLALPGDLGIVVVTDADPDGGADQALEAIAARNAARPGGPAVIAFITIAPSQLVNDALGRGLAERSGGPYLRVGPRPRARQ